MLYHVDPAWSAAEKAEVEQLSVLLGRAMAECGHAVGLAPLDQADVGAALAAFDPAASIVFNWCEGLPGVPHGEPLVAAALEELGFVFTGAGAAALALAYDKRQVKERLDRAGIPTPTWRLYDRPLVADWRHFPAIVKPANEHCSEGITPEAVVTSPGELAERIAYVLDSYRQPALVEDFIDGREFHVSLWGNGTIDVLPIAEMDFSGFADIHDRLCTYDSKFIPGSLHYEGIRTLLPAPLSEPQRQAIEAACRAAYQAVGCRDYGRIDLRLRGDDCYVLDVNPNADISADASLACAAELLGYSYGQVGSRIVELAAHRRQP